MKTKFTTAVLRDGYVYGLDDGIMQCMDIKTGQQKWKGGRYGHGQILLVDDLIIVQTEQGPVVLIEASPKKLTELGKVAALSNKTWNCPALAGKYLLVRNDREAVCYEVELAK
jgi:outer membrane protein assembly factor BamB